MRYFDPLFVDQLLDQIIQPDENSSTDRPVEDDISSAIQNALNIVRLHLQMDVAFVAEFKDGRRVFRYLDAEQTSIETGNSDPLDESYCHCIVEGKLPELMTDTADYTLAASLEVTEALKIGSYIGVPIELSDGQVYGTFCCFSHEPDHDLRERDVSTLRMFANFVGRTIEPQLRDRIQRADSIDKINRLIDQQDFHILYQPIYSLDHRKVVGVEALSRFRDGMPPDAWFLESSILGLGKELELATAGMALAGLADLPDDVFLSLNISPEFVSSPEFSQLLEGLPLNRIVLEITEHAPINQYLHFLSTIEGFRQKGMRLAIDDVGAGYSSLRHVLKLQPDIIKLDMDLIRNVDGDLAKKALMAALLDFADQTGCHVVAEGVETEAEFKSLRRLRVGNLQGFYIAHPMQLEQLAQFNELNQA